MSKRMAVRSGLVAGFVLLELLSPQIGVAAGDYPKRRIKIIVTEVAR
jgi:hypothetical protein